jgi:hypothetical protein
MLTPETPYPYPGSYALHVDMDQPQPSAAELVRIMWRRVDSEGRGFVAVSFPLRDGASGNKVVPADALIDGTALSDAEQREFHDLDRGLRGCSGKTPGQKKRAARRDALKSRTIWSRFLARQLRELRARNAVKQRAA